MRNVQVKFLGSGTRDEIIASHPYADQSEDDSGCEPLLALIDVQYKGALDVCIATRCVGTVPRDVNPKTLWQECKSAALYVMANTWLPFRREQTLWFLVSWDIAQSEKEVVDVFAAVQ